MREFNRPRYYYCEFLHGDQRVRSGIDPHLSYAEALTRATLLSLEWGSAVVVRDPLIRDGQEIQGESSVAYVENGEVKFPHRSV